MVSCAVHISLSVYRKYRQLQQRDEYALSAVVWPMKNIHNISSKNQAKLIAK
jgi:hypothetical protein